MFDKKRGKQKVEESNLEAGGSLAKERPAVLVLSALLIATAGTVLQIGGVSWDIMSHIQGATNGILMPSLLWYMISAIVPAVIADVILSKLIKSTKSKAIGIMEFNTIISGAIIGSVFYIMGFPILVWTFAEPLIVTPFDSMTELLPNFLNTLSAVLIFTLVVGATMGILGAWISSKITERIEIIA
jgi:hypothetical protein